MHHGQIEEGKYTTILLLGMFSHKMSMVTIFGHTNYSKAKNHHKFLYFSWKLSTTFEAGCLFEIK